MIDAAHPFGPGLPRPQKGELGVYVLGSGFGESIVVVLPDERVLFVDSATDDGVNLPAALLRHFGIDRIDVLVMSHPDLDHVKGFADLVVAFDPHEVWRYPYGPAVRDFVAGRNKGNRFAELKKALDAIDDHLERTGRVNEARYGTRSWPLDPAAFALHVLAPTPYDARRAYRLWERLMSCEGGRHRIDRVLAGDVALGDAPNVLSLGLALEWGRMKVLLGGDVMNGCSSPHSGWKGIVQLLRQDGRLDWVTDLAVVKVAHHGSRHSHEPLAWDQHAANTRPVGIVAPFHGVALPDAPTLGALRGHLSELGLTSQGNAAGMRAMTAGWTPKPMRLPRVAATMGCVVVVVSAMGQLSLSVGASGQGFDP